ncbi:MAG: hypothetical protein K8R90_08875 [Candidatus Cloacimonetes bacterium]|nr:hypothetical protein [Candidatus Cloacimonadota bacterium]
MPEIVDVNWNAFACKFDGREHQQFELLSYLLFCHEHEKEHGLFRYFNQAGIETEPVEVNDKCIGFQAKYLNTSISSNKIKIKNGLSKAKERNPQLNVIYYYLNREFSESRKAGQKRPQYQIVIETHANNLGIEIVWRVRSHFEKRLMEEKNRYIAQYFFQIQPSAIDSILQFRKQGQCLLEPIHTSIGADKYDIHLDRSKVIKEIEEAVLQEQVVLVSGDAGVGKTALIKEYFAEQSDDVHVYIVKTSRLSVNCVNEVFGTDDTLRLDDFIEVHQTEARKVFVFDSAEALSDIEDIDPFRELLSALIHNEWSVIFTVRPRYIEELKTIVLDRFACKMHEIPIQRIPVHELERLSVDYSFQLPENHRLLDVIRTPYYLNEYLSQTNKDTQRVDRTVFINRIWENRIMNTSFQKDGIHRSRSECFMAIALEKCRDGKFYIEGRQYNPKALHKLVEDEILEYDTSTKSYFITHDIFEEIALERHISTQYNRNRDMHHLLGEIGKALPMRRAFRAWLFEMMESDSTDMKQGLSELLIDTEFSKYWKDEILLSILTSSKAADYLSSFHQTLANENYTNLKWLMALLRTACKEFDVPDIMKGVQHTEDIAYLKSLFTKPKGSGWEYVIHYLFDKVTDDNILRESLPLLVDWTKKNETGLATSQAGRIVLKLYTTHLESNPYYGRQKSAIEKAMVDVIHFSSHEIADDLVSFYDTLLPQDHSRIDALSRTILTSMEDSFRFIQALPDLTVRIANAFWWGNEESDDYERRHFIHEAEVSFGLSTYCQQMYFPASAYQTPTWLLLVIHPEIGLKFIIDTVNRAVEVYAASDRGDHLETIELVVDGKTVTQHIDDRLWKMYRGLSNGPSVLDSMHMALEKWLLNNAKTTSDEFLDTVCKFLLQTSKSASITAVVTSVVQAYPEKLFKIAAILLRCKTLYLYDMHRFMYDMHKAKNLYSIGLGLKYDSKDNYRKERIRTCDDSFRSKRLETLALDYLLNVMEISSEEFDQRRETIWKILDRHYAELPEKAGLTKDDVTWKIFLARMDTRKMNLEHDRVENGKTYYKLVPEIDDEVKEQVDIASQVQAEFEKSTSIMIWAQVSFERNQNKYSVNQRFNENPQEVIGIVKGLMNELSTNSDSQFQLFTKNVPAYACAVLLRDYWAKIDADDRAYCADVLLQYASVLLSDEYNEQAGDFSQPTVSSLPLIIQRFSMRKNEAKALLLKIMLLNSFHSKMYRTYFRENMWSASNEDGWSIFLGYLALAPGYDEFRQSARDKNAERGVYGVLRSDLDGFIKVNTTLVESVMNKNEDSNRISLVDCGLEHLVPALEMLPSELPRKEMRQVFAAITKQMVIILSLNQRDHDSTLAAGFREHFTRILLHFENEFIEEYVKLIDGILGANEHTESILRFFILHTDQLRKSDAFWRIWDALYTKMMEINSLSDKHYYRDRVMTEYLIVSQIWKDNTREWHTLREQDLPFYDKVVDEMGGNPIVLYSIGSVLFRIGSRFMLPGITWLSTLISQHRYDSLKQDTVFFIESFMRRFWINCRKEVKRDESTREKAQTVLDFLFEQGSSIGHLLREQL